MLAAVVPAVAVAVAVVLAGCGETSRSSTQQASSAAGETEFDGGAALPGEIPAPSFTLTDQHGRSVSLAEYRGRVVVLSFLYSTCGGPCELIAQQIRGALDELAEEDARPPVVLIVSADPAADTPARIAGFLGEVSLSGRVHYLTGTPSELRSVWRAYRVKPASAGRATFDEYASVLLIDRRGDERVLFQSEQLTPEGISHDVRRLQDDG
jgi:protein SCO1/2